MSDPIQPWPLVQQGSQDHPVKTLQYLLGRGTRSPWTGSSGQVWTCRACLPAGRAWPSTAFMARNLDCP
jgi:hypothetical protein